MKPTLRALLITSLWITIGIIASFTDTWRFAWFVSGGIFLLLLIVDGLALLLERPLTGERKHAECFPLAVEETVTLTLHNHRKRKIIFSVFDSIPNESETNHFPWIGEIYSGGFTQIAYQIKFFERGNFTFHPAFLTLLSPIQLWQQTSRICEETKIKIFPNYEPVVRFALLSMENLENPMGINFKNKHGLSREFHQLREYQEGDVLTQIDWKASSKRLELISREYREQKNQSITVLLDCGKRMRATDGEITQFDHCLNAILLLSYIALRQGDKVGILSFGGTNRWLPPVAGSNAIPQILNHLYDIKTSNSPSDYSEAVERLTLRQKRRSLVILLTNLRGEDAVDLIPSLQLLRQRHLVVVANLRERQVHQALHKNVGTFKDAIRYCSNHLYIEERNRVLETLRTHSILSIDEPAEQLPVALANKYLEIKSSGQL